MSILRSLTNGTIDRAKFFLALAVLFVGMAAIFILPPFEGSDEEGHYSSMRHIAYLGDAPFNEKARLDKIVETYMQAAPFHYPHKNEQNLVGKITYRDLLLDPSVGKHFTEHYDMPGSLPPFESGRLMNWQMQHPPLYYLLSSLVVRLTEGQGLKAQFLMLRLFSFLMAFWALFIAADWMDLFLARVQGKEISLRREGRGFGAMVFVMPFLAPMFFPAFGRLGNDSLSIFFISLSLYSYEKWVERLDSAKRAMIFGLCLFGGLMTKAIFLPVVGGFASLLLLRLWEQRSDKQVVQQILDGASLIALPVSIGLVWYFLKYKLCGVFSGHIDFINFRDKMQQADLFSVPFFMYFRGVYGIVVSYYLWMTSSLKLLPTYWCLPFLWFSIVSLGGYGIHAIRKGMKADYLLPFVMIGLVVGGLLSHMIIGVSIEKQPFTPGWYTHVVLPLLALATYWGLGVAQRISRCFLFMALTTSAFYLLASFVSLAGLFGGCPISSWHDMIFLSDTYSCFTGEGRILAALERLVWPKTALFFLVVGLVSYICGIAYAWREGLFFVSFVPVREKKKASSVEKTV